MRNITVRPIPGDVGEPYTLRLSSTDALLDVLKNGIPEDQKQGDFLRMLDIGPLDLSGRVFKHIYFDCCNMEGADFSNSVFIGCSFSGAVLRNANLQNTAFKGCYMGGVVYQKATGFDDYPVPGVDMSGANLRNATISGQIFDLKAQNADMRGADISEGDWEETDLTGSNLSGATVPVEPERRPVKAQFRLDIPVRGRAHCV